jgi:hypothetical protein
MTTQEWIANDNKFYHVTQKSKIPFILEKGLLRKSHPYGICVIRSKHELILEYLCQMMLHTTNEKIFSVIEISPKKHNLKINEILRDGVEEITSPLHNYIVRDKLIIEKTDIVGEHIIGETIPNIPDFEKKLVALGLIEFLY